MDKFKQTADTLMTCDRCTYKAYWMIKLVSVDQTEMWCISCVRGVLP